MGDTGEKAADRNNDNTHAGKHRHIHTIKREKERVQKRMVWVCVQGRHVLEQKLSEVRTTKVWCGFLEKKREQTHTHTDRHHPQEHLIATRSDKRKKKQRRKLNTETVNAPLL